MATPKESNSLGAAGALLAGITWFATGVVAFALEGGGYGEIPSLNWYLVEAGHALGELGIVIALLGIHRILRPVSGRVESVGFWASIIGTVAVALATVWIIVEVASAGELHDEVGLAGILFGVGLLGWLIGFPVLGVVTLRKSTLPSWAGWLLISFVPLVFAIVALEAPGAGGIAVGALWFLLAAALRSPQGSQTSLDPGERPPSVPAP
jgi:hypothetical protein